MRERERESNLFLKRSFWEEKKKKIEKIKEDFNLFKTKKLLRRKNNFFSGKEEFENKEYFEKKKEPPIAFKYWTLC